jgi:hypothetical protein
VTKYNSNFLFPTIEGVPVVADTGVTLLSLLSVTVVGDASGNTECQNHPRFSEDPQIYEHCSSLIILGLEHYFHKIT